MVILGIDTGKVSGLAWLEDGKILKYMQGETEKLELQLPFDIAVLEEVHPFPQEGVVSAFTFGKSLGYWQGFLRARGFPYILVQPQVWKKELGIKTNVGKDKSKYIQRKLKKQTVIDYVNQRFSLNLSLKEEHIADAICLALYGMKKL